MVVQPDQITHLRDLRPDEFNPRKHNPRNIGQVGESLQQFGPMRSIVIDEHGTVLSGNGVVEAAAQVGIERVRVFDRETGELGPEPPGEGPYILAVRVTGLSEKQKQQYKVADNRTAELAEWDADVLKAMVEQGEAPDDWFFNYEMARLLGTEIEVDDPAAEWEGMPEYDDVGELPMKKLIVNFRSEADLAAFARLVEQDITLSTKSVWYPRRERLNNIAFAIVSEAGEA